MDWERLDRTKSSHVITKITHSGDEALFSGQSSEDACTALPFYKDFLLYRVTNYATLPSFSLDFLGDGDSFYLLDGSPDAIFMVNSRGKLFLKYDNIIDYIEFFLKYVTTEDGDIYIIQDPDTLPFLDSMSIEQQITLKQRFQEPTLDYNHDNDSFEMRCDIYYGGTLLKAMITVESDGSVSFSDQMLLSHNASELENYRADPGEYSDQPTDGYDDYTDPYAGD